MENPIPEAELKPIVEIDPSTTESMGLRFRSRNLPELDPEAKRRNICGVYLMGFGLTCKACGHNMPRLCQIPGYVDIFSISGREIWKQHIYCPKCSSEIVMENLKIISGATEYPPGAVRTKIFTTRVFSTGRGTTDPISALAASTNKLTINGSPSGL